MGRPLFFSALTVLLLAAGTGVRAEQALPAAVTAHPTDAGTFFADAAGMTLYTFDDDIGGNGSTCGGDCAKNFPPLLAAADARPVGAWSLSTRSNGDKQWALNGAPVYTYSGDLKPWDRNGVAFIPLLTAIANDPTKQSWHAAWQPLPLRPGIAIRTVDIGRVLADVRGMTLYARDRGDCSGSCLDQWTPVAAPLIANAKGDWGIAQRDDGTAQWSFRGKPLYTSRRDVKPDQVNGDGVDGTWHAVVIQPLPKTPPGVVTAKSDIGIVYADPTGHTLYAWFQPPDNLKKTCGDDCMRANWQPVTAPDNLIVGTGWTAVAGKDGVKQLAYGGLPIYRFAGDAKPGDIAGYNFGYRADQQSGAWQPVKPWY